MEEYDGHFIQPNYLYGVYRDTPYGYLFIQQSSIPKGNLEFGALNRFQIKDVYYNNKIDYIIEGSNINTSRHIKVYYFDELIINKFGNSVNIDRINDVNYYKIYVDDILINNKYYYHLEGRGIIYGRVDIINCDNNINNMVIRCFSSDDHRFIGEYKIDDGYYIIPNLLVGIHYDIVLVDKSRKIEQQVSSYRQPFKY